MKGTVYYFILLLLLLASCKREREPQSVPEELTKLERLYRIRPDSVMKSYDLSNDSLTEFPDLSKYVIASLDLSHNLLDTIIPERLPLGIERLNVSHNRLKGGLRLRRKTLIPTLKELNVSYNNLDELYVYEVLRIIASYNNIKAMNISYTTQYLDISYNKLSGAVSFDPEMIDTIIYEGAMGPPLYFGFVIH